MKIDWKKFVLCILIPLVVGGTARIISSRSTDIFNELNKPLLSPPGWLFPIVWIILYILMGYASYLIVTSGADASAIKNSIIAYGIQLIFNFFWPILFFNLQFYKFSFVWIVALWILIVWTMVLFSKISKNATYFMLPYLLWVTFAVYLNFGIAILN